MMDVTCAEWRGLGIVADRSAPKWLAQLNALVEKPEPEVSPSAPTVDGNYLLTPRIPHHLESAKPNSLGELPVSGITAAAVFVLMILAIAHGN